MAEEQRMAARYANDIEIAKAQRDFYLKKAAYDLEVEAKKAQSNLAADLQVWCNFQYVWITRKLVILSTEDPCANNCIFSLKSCPCKEFGAIKNLNVEHYDQY